MTNKEKVVSKKNLVVKKLLEYILTEKYRTGTRIPAERELIKILNTGRSTLREAIKILEDRNILYVKRGSGTYVKNIPTIVDTEFPAEYNKEKQIKNHLEFLYSILPFMGYMAAGKASVTEKEGMQNCIVKISKALIDNNTESYTYADKLFWQLLGRMSCNMRFKELTDSAVLNNTILWEIVMKTSGNVNTNIFGYYVEILNSIKKSSPIDTFEKIGEWLSLIAEIIKSESGIEADFETYNNFCSSIN